MAICALNEKKKSPEAGDGPSVRPGAREGNRTAITCRRAIGEGGRDARKKRVPVRFYRSCFAGKKEKIKEGLQLHRGAQHGRKGGRKKRGC